MFLQVSGKRAETENIFSIILEKPEDLSFYPGQYLDVEIADDSRAFTISSSPTERFLMITTKKGVSQFKKTIEKLKKGDMINTTHPIGTFTLDESQAAVFIAGGIGITPFRSIIKYVLDKNLATPITLIYSNSDKNFPFKSELDAWQRKLPNLKINYIITAESGRLTTLNAKDNMSNTLYYLAGSHSFVNAMERLLLDSGADETNIRYDRFDGY